MSSESEGEDNSRSDISTAVLVFAHSLGIDIESEPYLLHIAEYALRNLPPNWQLGIGEGDNAGIPYFFNEESGESVWKHPEEELHKSILNTERTKKQRKSFPKKVNNVDLVDASLINRLPSTFTKSGSSSLNLTIDSNDAISSNNVVARVFIQHNSSDSDTSDSSSEIARRHRATSSKSSTPQRKNRESANKDTLNNHQKIANASPAVVNKIDNDDEYYTPRRQKFFVKSNKDSQSKAKTIPMGATSSESLKASTFHISDSSDSDTKYRMHKYKTRRAKQTISEEALENAKAIQNKIEYANMSTATSTNQHVFQNLRNDSNITSIPIENLHTSE